MVAPAVHAFQQNSDAHPTGAFRFQLASDLHLEPGGVDLTEILVPAPGVTVLALCGDLCSPFSPQYPQLLAYAASLFPHVLVITGNNEYFNQNLHKKHRQHPTDNQQQQKQQVDASGFGISTTTSNSTARITPPSEPSSQRSPSNTAPSDSVPRRSHSESNGSSSTPLHTPPVPSTHQPQQQQQRSQAQLHPSSSSEPSHAPLPLYFGQKASISLHPQSNSLQSHTMGEVDSMVEALCSAHENITFLNNSCKVIQGMQFIGSTMWSWIPVEARSRVQQTVQDFSLVLSAPDQALTPHHSSDLFTRNLDFITSSLAAGRAAGLRNVVLTHHTPSFQGTSAPQYAGSDTTCSYSSSLDHVLNGNDVDVWCCGHTHHNFNQQRVGGCRLVSNQRGQRQHVEGFTRDFVVTVEAPAVTVP